MGSTCLVLINCWLISGLCVIGFLISSPQKSGIKGRTMTNHLGFASISSFLSNNFSCLLGSPISWINGWVPTLVIQLKNVWLSCWERRMLGLYGPGLSGRIHSHPWQYCSSAPYYVCSLLKPMMDGHRHGMCPNVSVSFSPPFPLLPLFLSLSFRLSPTIAMSCPPYHNRHISKLDCGNFQNSSLCTEVNAWQQ